MKFHLRLSALPMLAFAALAYAAEPAKPNILFILSDDQSHEAIRASGLTDIDTPNLDRLTARGTTFTHAYNMGAWGGAVCVASRTMLLTGRTLWHAHAIEKSLDNEREAGRLWPQRMAAQGYETYFSGKWHIQTNAERSFAHSTHIRAGMPRDTPVGYNRPLPDQPDPWNPSDPAFGGHWTGGKHWSEVLGDDSVAFIRQAAKAEKPFFMYLAFSAPHDPRQSPKEYLDRYPLNRIQIPESFLPEYPHNEAMGAGRDLRDERLAPFPRDAHAIRVNRQEYYAIVTHMDVQVGRILDALEESGEANNTWIIFTSDHGLAVGHHGLMGKQNMYDHSLRVPFIVMGPGVTAGARIDAPIYLQSAMATALELGHANLEGVQFQSLRPLLSGEGSGLRAVYGSYINQQRTVIHDGWKLILYPKTQIVRLYHLAKDPREIRDLAADPTTAARQKALFATLRDLQREHADPLDLETPYPQLR